MLDQKQKEELLNQVLPYIKKYKNLLLNKPFCSWTKEVSCLIRMTADGTTFKEKSASFFNELDLLRQSYDELELETILMGLAWETIDRYKTIESIEFERYFRLYFRWKVLRLLEVIRIESVKRAYTDPLSVSSYSLTPPPIRDIIQYKKSSYWEKYLMWLTDSGHTTREIARLTGLSKSLISKEMEHLC